MIKKGKKLKLTQYIQIYNKIYKNTQNSLVNPRGSGITS